MLQLPPEFQAFIRMIGGRLTKDIFLRAIQDASAGSDDFTEDDRQRILIAAERAGVGEKICP